MEDVEAAWEAAHAAVVKLRTATPEMIARFLDIFADNIEVRTEALVELTNPDTALPKEPRLVIST